MIETDKGITGIITQYTIFNKNFEICGRIYHSHGTITNLNDNCITFPYNNTVLELLDEDEFFCCDRCNSSINKTYLSKDSYKNIRYDDVLKVCKCDIICPVCGNILTILYDKE